MVDIMEKFGSDGYLVFFGTLELIARNWEQNIDEKLYFSWKFLRKKLGISEKKLRNIYTFPNFFKRIEVTFLESGVSIMCPKFSELKDNYTNDKPHRIVNNLEESGKKVSNQVEEEEEVEVDKELSAYRQGSDYFVKAYNEDFKLPYKFSKKDGNLYSQLSKDGLEVFKTKVDLLRKEFNKPHKDRIFKLRDKDSYSIPILSTVWNELVDTSGDNHKPVPVTNVKKCPWCKQTDHYAIEIQDCTFATKCVSDKHYNLESK